jgi:hypothetical protein
MLGDTGSGNSRTSTVALKNWTMRSRLIIGLWIVLMSCSDTETARDEVIVHGAKKNYWELELEINRKGQGWSIHNFSWDRYNVKESYWIYVPKITGRVSSNNVSISKLKNVRYTDKNNKGFIDFSDRTITINIEQALYPNGETVDGWEPFKLNGTYKLKFASDSID